MKRLIVLAPQALGIHHTFRKIQHMAFRAELTISGQQYDVLNCSFSMSRDTDAKGRPSSNVHGGRITLEIESTSDTSLIEAMVNNQFKALEGSVVFKKTDEDAKMKELSFKNAYIVYYQEAFHALGEMSMTIKFTLSAEVIQLGYAEHVNRWPRAA
jgi:hypothetical protein